MSPVETWITPKWSARRFDCVPFPAPCLPSSTSRGSAQLMSLGEEALVVPHHQLAVELLHGLEHYADCDEDCHATEGILDVPRLQHYERDDRDYRQVHRAGQRDPVEHFGEIALGRRAGPDARDEATLLANDVGLLLLIERDGRVEVREEHD